MYVNNIAELHYRLGSTKTLPVPKYKAMFSNLLIKIFIFVHVLIKVLFRLSIIIYTYRVSYFLCPLIKKTARIIYPSIVIYYLYIPKHMECKEKLKCISSSRKCWSIKKENVSNEELLMVVMDIGRLLRGRQTWILTAF